MPGQPSPQPPADQALSSGLPAGLQLATSLTLACLFFLPLAAGGYSGAGYLLALVILPLSLLAGMAGWSRIPWAARLVVLAYLLGLLAVPFMVQEGRELWAWLLPLPLGWCLVWLLQQVLPAKDNAGNAAVLGAGAVAFMSLSFWLIGGDSSARLSGLFGLPNAFAGYLLLAWPLCLLQWRRAVTGRMRLVLGLCLLCVVLALVFTYSRAAWLVLVLQLLIVGVALLGSRARRQAQGGSLHFRPWMLAGLLGGTLALGLLPPVREVLGRLFEFQGYSMQGRLRFWQAALEMWRDNPLFGVGPGNFGFVYPQYQRDPWWYSVDPHSWPLQLLSELGVPGLLLLLAILAGTVLWVRRIFSALPGTDAALFCAAVVGSMTHAAVDFDYTFPATTCLLGCLLALGSWHAWQHRKEDPALSAASLSLLRGEAPLRWLLLVLLSLCGLLGIALAAERFSLDRLRDTPGLPPRVQLELLTQAKQANPLNHATHYRIAALRAAPGGTPETRRLALAEVDTALSLNPRYPLAWALRGLIARQPADGAADLEKALELDPYNYPQHYFYWANAATDDTTRRERLLLCLERIPVTAPVTAADVRNDWISLNPVFARIYYELARLESDKRKADAYRQLGARFEAEAQRQRSR